MKLPNDLPLPGMEDKDITEIVQAAEDYVQVRDQRAVLAISENSLKEKLIATMDRFGKKTYRYRGILIEISNEPTLSVQAKDPKEDKAKKAEQHNAGPRVTFSRSPKPIVEPEPTAEESTANALAFLKPQAQDTAQADAEIPSDFIETLEPACIECLGHGQHFPECSHAVKANGLSFQDYLGYARQMKVKSAASFARKWQLSGEKDALVLRWKANPKKTAKRLAQRRQQPSR